ncbi:hypothetical protein AtubIFM57258_001981 [Aspergillus tubingensis]|nr:hypothetical protein AtubIFM57258_001981 [Aspergillus tubingensis]
MSKNPPLFVLKLLKRCRCQQGSQIAKRKDEGKFQANVSIRAKADWKTQLEWLVGSTRADDPVLFDPTLSPTSDKYDDMELKMGDIDLNGISEIVVESGKTMA